MLMMSGQCGFGFHLECSGWLNGGSGLPCECSCHRLREPPTFVARVRCEKCGRALPDRSEPCPVTYGDHIPAPPPKEG